jgi:hypothetical protein
VSEQARLLPIGATFLPLGSVALTMSTDTHRGHPGPNASASRLRIARPTRAGSQCEPSSCWDICIAVVIHGVVVAYWSFAHRTAELSSVVWTLAAAAVVAALRWRRSQRLCTRERSAPVQEAESSAADKPITGTLSGG